MTTPAGRLSSGVPSPALAAPRDRRPQPALATAIWLTIAIVGWAAIALMAASLLTSHPPSAAFDLELLLRAARAVAAGASPYDPSIVAGRAPDAVGLFFSYPPPVAHCSAWLPAGWRSRSTARARPSARPVALRPSLARSVSQRSRSPS